MPKQINLKALNHYIDNLQADIKKQTIKQIKELTGLSHQDWYKRKKGLVKFRVAEINHIHNITNQNFYDHGNKTQLNRA